MAVVEEKKTTDSSPSATDNSMEDILTTIRNVIAGEETTTPPTAPATADVLELTEIVKEGKAVESTPQAAPVADTAPSVKSEDIMKDIEKAVAADATTAAPTATSTAPAAVTEAENPAPETTTTDNPVVSALLSDATVKVSSETLKTFATLVTAHQNGLKFRSGMTLEEIVMEALKPQLGQWLDKHLPQMVMRIVEREIQKLLPNDE